MKVNKLISLSLTVIFSLIFLAGCKSGANAKKIVFIAQMSTGDYWMSLSDSLEKQAIQQGYDYEFTGPEEWDIKEQAEVIEKTVDEKPDAIILAPIGDSDLFAAIKKANDADIPIILIDNDINRELLESYGAHVSTYVGIDNHDGGAKVADELLSKVSKDDKVAVLYGNVNSINCENRCDGFYDGMKDKGMDVAARITCESGSDSEEAYENTKLLLTAYPDIKVFFAANSPIYKGMEKALLEYNVSAVTGTFDCDDEILNSIKEGRLTCTLDQNSEGVAEGVIEVINSLMKGEKVNDITITDGKMITG